MENIKELNLITYSKETVNIVDNPEIVDINNFIDTESLTNNFFNNGVTTLNINVYKDFEERIKDLENAESIEAYNSLIKEIKNSNPNLFQELNEFGIEYNDKNNFLINKNNIFNTFVNNLLLVYPNVLKKWLSTDLWNSEEQLYLSYGLVSGMVNPTHPINAFIFNRKVNVNKDFLTIQLNLEENTVINYKAILYILDFANNYVVDFKDSFANVDEFLSYLSEIINYNVPVVEETSLVSYLNAFSKNKSTLKFIPSYTFISYNLEKSKLILEDETIKPSDVTILNTPLINDISYYKNQEINGEPLIQINKPLNIFQKFAIRSAINENTLIYGPPGTGKSEIISNIVANLMIKNVTVMMTCEKQDAMNVVYTRLNELKDFTLKIDNEYGDKYSFFKQISNLFDKLGNIVAPASKSSLGKKVNDIYKFISENERASDYYLLNKDFSNLIRDYIKFCNARDSRDNDYKSYVIAKTNINKFINDRSSEILEMYNRFSSLYPRIQNEIDFIIKISEYDNYIQLWNISKDEVVNLINVRNDFTTYLVNDCGIKNVNSISYDQISKNVKLLETFLENTWLSSNSNFIESLREEPVELFKTYKIMCEINDSLNRAFSATAGDKAKTVKKVNNALQWLVDNAASHPMFIEKMSKLSDEDKIYGIYNYFEQNSLNVNKKPTVKYPNNEQKVKEYKIIYNCILMFNQIKISTFSGSSLIELCKVQNGKEIFTPINTWFLVNKNYLSEQFFDLFNKKVEYFNTEIINSFYKTKLNEIGIFLRIENDYQSEILYANKFLADLNLNNVVKDYIRSNTDCVARLNSVMYEIFVDYLRDKILKQNEEFKKNLLEMAKLAYNTTNLPEIDEFILKYYDQLKVIFPVWFLKPDLIAQYIPFEKEVFDYVIFDEASQIVLEKTYSILYRAKKAVICGDPKQLQPEVGEYIKEKLPKSNEIDKINFDASISLLDRARTSYWNTFYLKNHYRSVSHKLIDYSNWNFYNNQLVYVSKNKNKVPPFEINTLTDGKCVDNINDFEARTLIKRLKELLKSDEAKKFNDILIITFTNEQAEYIKKLINDNPIENDEIIRLMKENKIGINYIPSLQGAEADVCLISAVFDVNTTDLGLLSLRDASSFLNVAITRAKYQNIIFKSLNFKNADLAWQGKNSLFLNYVRYLDDLEEKINDAKNNAVEKPTINNNVPNSSFKLELMEKLTEYFEKTNSPLKCVMNLNIGTFTIDIAIYNEDISNIKTILMLNEYKKYVNYEEFVWDLDKYSLLKSNGYEVLILQEINWLSDQNEVINTIQTFIDNLEKY